MFLEFPISTSDLLKSCKTYLRRYSRIHLLVLAESPTCIGRITYWYGQITNQYWPNCLPVLAKSPACIGQITYRYWPNSLPVLAKSPSGIGKIINQYWRIWQCIHINYAYPYCRHSEIVYRYWWNWLLVLAKNCLSVLAKSPTDIGQIVYHYWWNWIPRKWVGLFQAVTSWG